MYVSLSLYIYIYIYTHTYLKTDRPGVERGGREAPAREARGDYYYYYYY